jgi:hypothetical protein
MRFVTTLFSFMIVVLLGSQPVAAAYKPYYVWQTPVFNKGIDVHSDTSFFSGIQMQGSRLDFNKGSSKIYDDGHLTITTDDVLRLNASQKVLTSDDLQVGHELIIANYKELRDTGSHIYDDAQMHIKTDDYLYLDAPTMTYISTGLSVGTTLNVGGATTLGSSLTIANGLTVTSGAVSLPAGVINGTMITNGTVTVDDLSESSVTSAKILDGTIVAADLASGVLTSTLLADDSVVNADINSAAAIAGTKVNPDFGAQNITTSGNIGSTAGTLTIGGGTAITKHLSGTAALNLSAPGAVPGCVDTTAITVTGAALGDTVVPSMSIAIPSDFSIDGFVSATNSVKIRLCQFTGSAVDPDSTGGATYRVDVWKH